MHLIEHDNINTFRVRVESYLMEREAENCVQLGAIEAIAAARPMGSRALATPRLWTIEQDQQLLAVAMQFVTDSMIVTRCEESAAMCVANYLLRIGWAGKSLVGVVPGINALVQKYSSLSHRTATRFRSLRVFELRDVIAPRPVPGSLRMCDANDRALFAKWVNQFAGEIGEPESAEASDQTAGRLIDEGRAFFWVDRLPVAMGIWTGRTKNGKRITLVFTPPESRGRGYASNLVAALSQRILDEGFRFCFLHTDQANPTSNSIYQRLGYKPICDTEDWWFASAG